LVVIRLVTLEIAVVELSRRGFVDDHAAQESADSKWKMRRTIRWPGLLVRIAGFIRSGLPTRVESTACCAGSACIRSDAAAAAGDFTVPGLCRRSTAITIPMRTNE
jgi:hypothetical protein